MLYTGSVLKVYLLIVVSKLSNKRLMISKIVVSKLSNKRLMISKIVVLNFDMAFLHLL